MRSFRRKLAGLRPGGFTLVELAVVSAILAGLAVAVVTYVGSTSQTVNTEMTATVDEVRTGVDTSGLGQYGGGGVTSAFVTPTYVSGEIYKWSDGIWGFRSTPISNRFADCPDRPYLVSINGATFVEVSVEHNGMAAGCDMNLGSLGAASGDQVQFGFDYINTQNGDGNYDSAGNYLYSSVFTLN
jgi:prepilin-type N-terminal cleavage/methylation domain-containing protein